MKYFIDHNKKSIHQQKFAGDRCGFVGTPITSREFTNCPKYVERLIAEKNYKICSQCKAVQITMFS